MIRREVVSLVLFFTSFLFTHGKDYNIFKLIELHIDSMKFTSLDNMISINGVTQLYFIYNDENEVCEVKLYPKNNQRIKNLTLFHSGDFEIIDSLLFIDNTYYRFKVRFINITKSQFLKFTCKVLLDTSQIIEEIHLFPCTQTSLNIYPSNDELYIGEEKEFELITNNVENIRYSTDWTSGNDIDYRIVKKNGRLFVYLLPNKTGRRMLEMKLRTNKPSIDEQSNISYNLSPLLYNFLVKASRLQYLNIDKKEVTLDENTRMTGVEVQLDNSRLLTMNKTYRIENQEEPGGALIAEIFTKSSLANNRILCQLRVYNYHRNSEGYLYIKDGDNAKFITNFTISPKTQIEKISILREGGDWQQNLSVYPGEKFDLKIQGQGLHKAQFHFEDLEEIGTDTLIKNEYEQVFKLKVPVSISKKQLNIYNHSKPSGYYLTIKEYQEPRPFDYIFVNYGDLNRLVSSIHGPILYNKTVRDVVFSFNNDKIDSNDKLFGKQYLKFDIQINSMKNELIEMKAIDNVVICPSDRSPRSKYYNDKNCWRGELSLNKYIRKKTYDLDEWTSIKVTIQHDASKYGGESIKKDVEIILKKKYKFDIDVSFPAGLITVYKTDKENEESGETERVTEFGNLWGVSMAMIAQFSFYHPDKIAKLRPYKVGAGFIALNAFNLSSSDTNQDLAFVILGSLYPTSKDNKLSFPLYFGGGLKMLDRSWMFLIGPGIRIRL